MDNISKLKRRNNLEQWLMVAPAILVFLFIIIIPTFVTFVLSLFQWDGIGKARFIGILNFVNLFGGKIFWTPFRNNFIALIVYCSFPIIIGLLLAVFLANSVSDGLGFRVSNLFRGCYYLPQIIPGTAFLLAWRWI
ncbi:MAG: hypothetical protein LBP74_01940, partial [Treponema sp.]|nr:hypothetical protein [Treponema sp.]